MKLTTAIALGAILAALIIYWPTIYAFHTKLIDILYQIFRSL